MPAEDEKNDWTSERSRRDFRAEVEHIARNIVHASVARFLTSEEIDKRIDQRTAQRWRNMGLTASPNPYEPTSLEDEGKELVEYIRRLKKETDNSKGRIAAMLGIVMPILTAISMFVGGCYWLFTHISMSVK